MLKDFHLLILSSIIHQLFHTKRKSRGEEGRRRGWSIKFYDILTALNAKSHLSGNGRDFFATSCSSYTDNFILEQQLYIHVYIKTKHITIIFYEQWKLKIKLNYVKIVERCKWDFLDKNFLQFSCEEEKRKQKERKNKKKDGNFMHKMSLRIIFAFWSSLRDTVSRQDEKEESLKCNIKWDNNVIKALKR